MPINQTFIYPDQAKEALKVIKHYVRYKEEYPNYYYDFFFKWSLINPLYNAYSNDISEGYRVKVFGKKNSSLWNESIENYSKKLVSLECVGKGRNDAIPRDDIKQATLFLRKEFQINSDDICRTCRKIYSCTNQSLDDFQKFEAIMKILYQIRCNLFHGDKPELNGAQGERNKKLVRIGNRILTNILQHFGL